MEYYATRVNNRCVCVEIVENSYWVEYEEILPEEDAEHLLRDVENVLADEWENLGDENFTMDEHGLVTLWDKFCPTGSELENFKYELEYALMED